MNSLGRGATYRAMQRRGPNQSVLGKAIAGWLSLALISGLVVIPILPMVL